MSLLENFKPIIDDAIILMMDSSDRFTTPNALKIINKFYQNNTMLVFTK